LAVGRFLLEAAAALTTPLLPDDYLGLVDPLRSRRGWRGRVTRVQPETADAATIVIRPGTGWKSHRAGQYVRVGAQLDGVWHWRPFSLSSAPGEPGDAFAITVKANRNGVLSPYLTSRVRPGTVLRLEPPRGDFVLPPDIPPRLLFVTAGSGITPVMSILRLLEPRGASGMPDVVVVHSAPTRDDVIFGTELRALAARFPSVRLHEQHTRARADGGGRAGGRLTAAALPAVCPDWHERSTWACGPPGLLADVEARWRQAGIADRLRVERFQLIPAQADGAGAGAEGAGAGSGAGAGAGAVRVRFIRTGRQAAAAGDIPLLHVGENAGVLMPSGCRMGICHSCVARLVSGRLRDLRTGQEYGDEGDLVQTCVSAAAGDVEIDL
jgi:stearoyl-CoA 9-desaturase NADPH oxidoreductase